MPSTRNHLVQRIVRWHVQTWAQAPLDHPAPTAHSLAEAMEAMELSASDLAQIAEVSPATVRAAATRSRDREDGGRTGERAVAMRCYLMDVVEQLDGNTSADPGPCWYWPEADRDAYLNEMGIDPAIAGGQ